MEKSKTYLEVEIFFKDGDKDWVSPIENPSEDIYIKDNELKIDNGYNVYAYDILLIDKVDITKILDDDIIERETIFSSNTPTTIKEKYK